MCVVWPKYLMQLPVVCNAFISYQANKIIPWKIFGIFQGWQRIFIFAKVQN